MAISHALTVLGWYELPADDQPDESIWLDSEALDDHFRRIKDRYSRDSGMEPIEDVPDAQNEFTRDLRKA